MEKDEDPVLPDLADLAKAGNADVEPCPVQAITDELGIDVPSSTNFFVGETEGLSVLLAGDLTMSDSEDFDDEDLAGLSGAN